MRGEVRVLEEPRHHLARQALRHRQPEHAGDDRRHIEHADRGQLASRDGARHLLVDAPGGLAGVIDRGDGCIGDPARDLPVAVGSLPPPARRDVWRTPARADHATRARARFVCVARSVQLLVYALDVGDAPRAAEAEIALGHALARVC